MSDRDIENEIQAKGLAAPSLTPAHIESLIVAEHIIFPRDALNEPAHAELARLTICVLVLRNGFMVTGESACVHIDNFDAEKGAKAARAHAINKIWALEGYLLKQQLFDAAQ